LTLHYMFRTSQVALLMVLFSKLYNEGVVDLYRAYNSI